MATLLLIGASGLVGQRLLQLALTDPTIGRVTAPTRRPLPQHAKLDNPLVDFDHLPEDAGWWAADAAICTLGTTLRQAGSPDAFTKVDYGYVLAAARLARKAGTPCFVLNSSLGANEASAGLYLRVKGEVERDLAALDFSSLTLVRPSLLDGGRPDKRLAEEIGLFLSHLLGCLIPRRYRAVRTVDVAACLLQAAIAAKAGRHVIESEAIGRE